ncbi:lipid A 1-phosphatase LpxE [Ochrobactrum sp. CM-21-5]|nr:lipid A 1-phosphatase LpxE [Ochrobactrum sp. CM-21-5]MBC2884860.1 lipid A 1-phosphatase LpxE [Ochrobactrum sp. CM-21-5]
MTAQEMKTVLLNPVRAALELVRALIRPAYKGAPSSWTLEMTAVAVLLPFVILVLHLWDADIIRAAAQSTNIVMEILRTTTDAIRTVVWLGVALVVWLATAFMLSPSFRGGMQNTLVKLHGWATLVLFSIVVGSVPVEIGKLAIGRARPFLLDEVGAAYFSPFNGKFLYESFPSGHSMMAGIMMASLWIFLPRWRVLTVPACLLFGVSRLAAGAHYPTDVVAGLVIGFIAAWWVARYLATRNIIFLIDDESALPRV